MSKKEKGKLDRSASVTIGGTLYNVHPNVKRCLDGMYQEYMSAANILKQMVPFEEKEREILNKIVTTFEPMPDLPKELVGIIQDIKDLMKPPEPPAKSPDEKTVAENVQEVAVARGITPEANAPGV